jgi:hypothetical protein
VPIPVSKSASLFTRAELEASIPFVAGYRLDGEIGQRLLHRVLDAFSAVEARTRARKKADQERLERTASALLANLLVARRNRHNAMIFVGVSFETSRYSGGDLSVEALRKLREFLWADGLVEGQQGYYSQERWDSETTVHRHSRTTRLRATARLLGWVEEAGIDLAALPKSSAYGIRRERASDLVLISDGEPSSAAVSGPGPEPDDVKASRAIIAETNRLIAAAAIELPATAWERRAADAVEDTSEGEQIARIAGGDQSSITLTRRFNGSWSSGGRLYGGFWQNLKKRDRRQLTINGVETVELDYARLHPTLLYAQAGLKLDFDPYLPDGFDLRMRDVGKETFGRLLNSKTVVNASRWSRPAKAPENLSLADFRRFAQALIEMHRPIAGVFGTGASLRLQHLDSEILLKVLARMNALGVVALPVHDSVIVARPWAEDLHQAMRAAYHEVTGHEDIQIKQT